MRFVDSSLNYGKLHTIMALDEGPVVQSALLRNELVRLRKQRGLTQEQVATSLEWSPSKLIRVEGGRSSITKVDLDALLQQYGLTSRDQRDRLHTLNHGAREQRWWNDYRDDITPTYLDYVGYEVGAAVIRQFQGSVVPGLLQTPDYAEALTAYGVEPLRVGAVVRLRLQRQRYLAQRSSPPQQHYVMDEAVIRRYIGVERDPAIMPNQLLHIVELAERDEHINVRIVPFKAGAHAGLSGPFTLLEFTGGLPDILYRDAGRETIAMTPSNPEVAAYADSFESLLGDSISAEDSIAFLRTVAEEMS
jgi:transcriptional regulator with XRE-family HTH domain